jgi:uncharacterized RDD family membrane protein YckC
MRTWVMILGWIGFIAGLILGALGLAGYGPRLALELLGVVLLVLGAATEGYYFGARRYLRRAQLEGQKAAGPR